MFYVYEWYIKATEEIIAKMKLQNTNMTISNQVQV